MYIKRNRNLELKEKVHDPELVQQQRQVCLQLFIKVSYLQFMPNAVLKHIQRSYLLIINELSSKANE